MQAFDKLIDMIRSKNPELITEEVANDITTQFNTELDSITDAAREEGRSLGFHEGYEEGKQVADDQARAKTEELLAQLDEEQTNKLSTIVDMINAEHAEKLEKVYQFLVNDTISKSEHEAEIAALDEEAAGKLEEACAAQDAACAEKLQLAVEAVKAKCKKDQELIVEQLTEKHSKMLNEAVEAVSKNHAKKMEKAIQLVTDKKLTTIAESVNKFISYKLDEAIPKKELISEQKYNFAMRSLDKIKDTLKINAIIQESADGIFEDYENKLKAEQDAQNKLLTENAELKSKLDKQEAQLVLESKITKCVPSEATFLRNYFKNAQSPSIIEEQIEDARASYKKVVADRREKLVTEAAKKTVATPKAMIHEEVKPAVQEKNEQPEQTVITEEAKPAVSSKDAFVAAYAGMLRKK